MSDSDPIVIVAAKRTPIGAFQGQFNGVPAAALGAAAITGALQQAGLDNNLIDEAVFGCVLQAGQGQAPARQAVLGAGLPKSLPCTTVNKMCGSGLKAVMFAHDTLLAGNADIALAGGMESMTNAPYLLPKARGGYRLGNDQIFDHMFLDGLQDAYEGHLMGYFADATAKQYGFSREQQDTFTIESVKRAQRAVNNGDFAEEIAPVTVTSRKGEVLFDRDETPGCCNIEKIPNLKPAFNKEGTVTAANSSSISDGAAALVLMRQSRAQQLSITPLARIVGHASHAQEPALFTAAPSGAVKKLLNKIRWHASDVDLYEINEAFAMVTMIAMRELELDHAKVNVNGGATALGHPIGATGARILTTLLYALKAQQLNTRKSNKGIASLCIGGGEAVAVAIELI